ncbi:MAG: hypothetical protein WAM30_20735 [Candidatus Dormiibacterota bacterium]
MLQYDIAVFAMTETETRAARRRLAAGGTSPEERSRRNLRQQVGVRLIKLGLRLAAARG